MYFYTIWRKNIMSEQTAPSREILILKLSTGEEILADCHETEEGFVANKPVSLQPIPDENSGKMKMSFATFMPYIKDDTVFVMKSQIIAIAQPKEPIVQSYSEMTGKIILPENKIQLAS